MGSGGGSTGRTLPAQACRRGNRTVRNARAIAGSSIEARIHSHQACAEVGRFLEPPSPSAHRANRGHPKEDEPKEAAKPYIE